MVWKEGASIPAVTAWGSASVIPRAASEQSEGSFLRFSLTSVGSSQVFRGTIYVEFQDAI